MLTSIHIKGFKGFRDTTIAPLRKVNLILGGQNVGKTSLLEAVYLAASDVVGFSNLPGIFRSSEGHDNQRYLQSVLGEMVGYIDLESANGYVLKTCINSKPGTGFELLSGLTAQYVEAHRYIGGGDFAKKTDARADYSDSVRVMMANSGKLAPDEARKTIEFLNPLAVPIQLAIQEKLNSLFGQVVLGRKKTELIALLHEIEPRLVDLNAISPDGETRVYAELKDAGNALPIPQLGHGFGRLLHLYASLLVTNSKLALIDEVENGVHYSALPVLMQGIENIAKDRGVQTLMTTHSWDCIRAAYQTFADAENLKDFQLIRLERDADNIKAVVINDGNLETVMEAGYEVR